MKEEREDAYVAAAGVMAEKDALAELIETGRMSLRIGIGAGEQKERDLTDREEQLICDALRCAQSESEASVTRSAVVASGERRWEWPVNTVGKMIANLQTLPPEMPFYTAYFVEIDGRRVTRTTHPSLSRETVFDGRVQRFTKDENMALVVWATAAPAEPDAFAAATPQSASEASGKVLVDAQLIRDIQSNAAIGEPEWSTIEDRLLRIGVPDRKANG